MRRPLIYLLFAVTVIVFSCTKEQNNPYDRECPPEIWSPAGLTASQGANGVLLTWTQQADHFDGFLVERSTDSINWVTVNTTLIDKSKKNYIDTGNLPGGKMYYRISAKADKNQSNYFYATSVCLVPPGPGSIAGKNTVQQNEKGVTYSVLKISGATSYNWAIPADATIVSGQGTTSIAVNFGISGGNIGVQAENNCGKSSTTHLAVTTCQVPATPGAISGKTTVQQNETGVTYSILQVSGATSYTWAIPTDATIVSGQGTTSIIVNFGTSGGSISVQAENSCGRSNFANLTVHICLPLSKPSFIIGKDPVGFYETGVLYSTDPVNGALSYHWKVPSDATIVSGQGSASIKVNFGKTCGAIGVQVENDCSQSDYFERTVCVLSSFTDFRDGKSYATVQIGTQVWMAENLAYLPAVSPPPVESFTALHYYVYGYSGTDVGAAKTTTNYSAFGVLYNWPAALVSCPDGWHLPGEAEWTTLTDYLIHNGYGYGGHREYIAKSLASKTNWNYESSPVVPGNNPESNNNSCFSGLPGGNRSGDGHFFQLGYLGYWWSHMEFSTGYGWIRYLHYHDTFMTNVSGSGYGAYGYSVRCLKDD